MKNANGVLVLAVVAISMMVTAPHAAVLLDEDFSYPDGLLEGQGGWAVYSGAGGKAQMVDTQRAVIQQSGGSGEDTDTPLSQIQGDDESTYYCFDLVVPSIGPSGGATLVDVATWFAGVREQPAGFFFMARAWIAPPNQGGDFTLGLSSTSGTMQANWPADLSFDTVYRVAGVYHAATGESRLWIDPASEASASISDATGFANDNADYFFLRQVTSSLLDNSFQIIDNLRVAETFAEACDLSVPVENETWGGIKSIYR